MVSYRIVGPYTKLGVADNLIDHRYNIELKGRSTEDYPVNMD